MCVCCLVDSEAETLDSDLGQVGTHAFSRMEGDVDKQRKLILQGQLSDATMQKQHQRKCVTQLVHYVPTMHPIP